MKIFPHIKKVLALALIFLGFPLLFGTCSYFMGSTQHAGIYETCHKGCSYPLQNDDGEERGAIPGG